MLRGDCSIRTLGPGFTAEEIDACAQRQGLLSIELELAGSSQCDCQACRAGGPQEVLSSQEVRKLVDDARALGCRKVILVDGEENSSRNLEDAIEHCRVAGMDIELFLRQSQITPEPAAYLRAGNVAVSVELTDLDDLAKVESLKGRPLAVRIAARPDNLSRLPRIWRWARSNDIEPQVQIITPRGTPSGTGQVLSPVEARAMFEELGRIDHDEFGRSWEVAASVIGRSCKRHLYACHVTPCGTIFACVGLTIPLGNVRTETLRDILFLSEVLENIRGFGSKVKEPCRACSKSTDCYGCRGAAYQLTGDYLAGDSMCWKNTGAVIGSLPTDARGFIPHGPTIRMIDRLTAIGERTASLEFTVPANSLWTDETGTLDEVAYIEMIAQSFAASHGFHRWAHEAPDQQGLLLGIRDLQIAGRARVGQKLTVHLRKVARFGDFGLVEADIRHEDGVLIASGQIKLWSPGEDVAKALFP